jgi:y4mF family transcriptional regulator
MVRDDRGDPPNDERAASLAEAVRRRRTDLGLRQAEVADLAGCSQRFVHTVEQGKPSLRLDKILDVLEVLGLSLAVVPGRGRIHAPAADPSEAGKGA